jgi:CRP-like cAMP-binding protein
MKPKEPLSSDEKKTALRIFWGPLRKNDRNDSDNDKIKFLKRIPFFEQLKKRQLELVAQVIYARDYREGEFIFETGQPGAALFIIQSGEVSVEIAGEHDQSTQLAVLHKQAFLGELALLDESPRSASARAIVPTKVLALFRKDLDQLAETSPDITTHIYKALAQIVGNRLKATNELIEKKLKAVA